MFCDIGSDGMDSTVLNSSRVGQFLKRLKELVWKILHSDLPRMQNSNLIIGVHHARL
jgi:hypothetical protein